MHHWPTRWLVVLACCCATWAPAADKPADAVPAVLQFKMKNIAGKEVDLAQYRGKVLLVVNVASECGATPQYQALQDLHEKYKDKGFAVLGFPANDFGRQEPGTDEQIQKFCSSKYGVKFDLFSKVVVKGDGQCGLYGFLTSKDTDPKFGGPVKWNFEKFLINKQGEIVGRFATGVEPDAADLVTAVEAALAK